MFLWEAANKLVFDINVGKITGHGIEMAATAFCRKKWYQFTNICAMLRVDHSKLISFDFCSILSSYFEGVGLLLFSFFCKR